MASRQKKSGESPSARRARIEAAADGRGINAAYTSGARNAERFGYKGGVGRNGKAVSQTEGMRQAWDERRTVRTYTSSRRGRMSTNGSRAGGSTWTMTQKDENGNTVRQSGRSKMASRRQRYYDVRVGLGLAGG